MHISYLADRPELAAQLIPGLLEHWRYMYPEDTAEARAARFRAHENREALPIAWVAHDGDTALGTAALRQHDLPGREDLGPWLGGVYVEPRFRGRGIASELCQVVELHAARLGVEILYLFTHGQESLYQRLGWQHLERMAWRGQDCSIMWKRLSPDRSQCLDALEGVEWCEPTYRSYLVETIHRLRTKPVRDFSVEDLRIAIGQDVGLPFLVPIALERLELNPLIEGDFYPGDLLVSLLSIKGAYWESRPEERQKLEAILARVGDVDRHVETAIKTYRERVG